MKKITSILFAAIIIFTACSKDDDNPANIEGTWTTNLVVVNSYLNGALIGSDSSTTGTLIFGSDGTLTSIDDNGTDTGTYTYDATSKQLTVISDGDSSVATVTNLTANNLHIKSDESSEFDGITYRYTADADYKR